MKVIRQQTLLSLTLIANLFGSTNNNTNNMLLNATFSFLSNSNKNYITFKIEFSFCN